MALNNKQIKAIELFVYSPYMTQTMIAQECGVHRETIRRWKEDEEFKSELDKAIKKRWKDAESIAVNTMINLASEGNIQAAKYMLDNLGYKPTEKIEADISTDIHINIE
jgi:uncharacterized protein YjcR